MSSRLEKAEARANEFIKKYEESKQNYFRIRDERDRLRAEIDKAKGSAQSISTSGDGGKQSSSAAGAMGA